MEGRDRRKFERRELPLEVRFIAENQETTGKIINISEGGLAMSTDAAAAIGDAIIAYPEGLGRLTGKVVRVFEGGIAIQFELSETQREYLSKRIEAAVDGKPYIRLVERRAHQRMPMNLESQGRRLDTREMFPCSVIDISETGAGVRSSVRPPVGASVQIGSLKGVVRRHTKEGFGIEFAQIGASEAECA